MKILSDNQLEQVISKLEYLSVSRYETELFSARRAQNEHAVEFWSAKYQETRELIASLKGL